MGRNGPTHDAKARVAPAARAAPRICAAPYKQRTSPRPRQRRQGHGALRAMPCAEAIIGPLGSGGAAQQGPRSVGGRPPTEKEPREGFYRGSETLYRGQLRMGPLGTSRVQRENTQRRREQGAERGDSMA